ncbi:23S rRNA accumulation protein YceD [Catenovulum sp. SM1970]|uniref:23S rRNA accumulation protein YceD n=1 Tax=Marinifaba aquimaris TaxID=2741323 RepID=UPI0015747EC8|nr:23S rRNA accumulation protein YceD [Marinifaba aquimaris]NTS77954.1 23S rRNA accumulation protein YceD [Marinifaba aquimaris]
MQKVKMPIELDPIKSAQIRSSFSGIYRLEDLSRFKEVVLDQTGEVTVNLECKLDEQGLTVLLLSADAEVQVTCQRCGGALPQKLNLSSKFTPKLASVDEELIPSEYEIITLNDYGMLELKALVEDELILALPIVPKHDEDDCDISEDDMSFGEVEDEPSKPNPFEALKNLKFQKD